MGILICLFCYLPVTAQISIADYAAGVLPDSHQDLFSSAVPSDSGVLFSTSGRYDLLYRETGDRHNPPGGDHMQADAFGGRTEVQVNGNDAGIWFGAQFGRTVLDRFSANDRVSGIVQLSSGRAGVLGWIRRGIWTGRLAIDGNPRYFQMISETSFFGENGGRLVNSPAINFSGFLNISLPQSDVELGYRNRPVLSGRFSLRNQSNAAFRQLSLQLDEHRWNAAVARNVHGTDWSIGSAVYILRSVVDLDRPVDYPLEVTGGGFSLSGGGSFRKIRNRPEFSAEMETGNFQINGYDAQARRFLKVESSRWQNLLLRGGLHPGAVSDAGFFGTLIWGLAGKGNLALYPFSNWLYLLDLPDRVRLSEAYMDIRELGINGAKIWKTSRHLALRTELAVSGCLIDGSITTENLVRYIGLIPVYEDKQTSAIGRKKYLLLRARLEAHKQLGGHDLYLSAEQMVPVELRGAAPEPAAAPDEGTVTENAPARRRYGGLKIECGMSVGGTGR